MSPYSNFNVHHYRLTSLRTYHTTGDALTNLAPLLLGTVDLASWVGRKTLYLPEPGKRSGVSTTLLRASRSRDVLDNSDVSQTLLSLYGG